MSSTTPNRSATTTAQDNVVTTVHPFASAAAIDIKPNPYVNEAQYASPTTTCADATSFLSSPFLGREVRYLPTVTYTPVLASSRLLSDHQQRRAAAAHQRRISISEQEMEELNVRLQNLSLHDDDEKSAVASVEAVPTVAEATAAATTTAATDDDDVEEEQDQNQYPLLVATSGEKDEKKPVLMGRVPMSMVNAKTNKVTEVLRSSRLNAKHHQAPFGRQSKGC